MGPRHTKEPTRQTVQPLAALDYFVTQTGSQFCVQPFSLNRFAVEESGISLGRICDADLLFTKAGAHSCVHRMTHISVTLENAGSGLRPFDSYQQVIEPFRGHEPRSLRVIEIKVDFDAFGRAGLNNNELRRWLKRPNSMVLLQCCLVALTLNFDPRFARVVESGAPIPGSANNVSSMEVRVSCLERDAGRQKLLDGELLNRYCKMDWVSTGVDRYGGPAGYLLIRQTSDKPRVCCDLLLRNIVLATLDEDADRRAFYRPVKPLHRLIIRDCPLGRCRAGCVQT